MNTSPEGRLGRLWGELDRGEKLSVIALGVLLIATVQAIGTSHPVTLAAATLFAALALGGSFAIDRDPKRTVPWPALLMVALAGICLLQAMPLPVSWVQAIAPQNADIWERALSPFGETVSTAHVSLDPGATFREATKGFLYAIVFILAARLSELRGMVVGVVLVFVSAILLAVVMLAHHIVGASSVFGLYEPIHTNLTLRIGPLLNPNNLVGYLNLGFFCGAGLLCSRRPPGSAGLLGVGMAVLVATAIWSGSRAGLLVFGLGAIGFAVLLVLARRQRRDRVPLRTPLLVIGASVAFGAALALLGADTKTRSDLGDQTLAKLSLFESVPPLIGDFRWLGVGRGAFESVFPAYRPPVDGNAIFTHPENLPLQWTAEWGLVVSVVSLSLLAFWFRPKKVHAGRRAVASGAWVGGVTLVAHNMADLSLELPGVAVGLVVLMGTLWGSRAPTARSSVRRRGRARSPRMQAALNIALLVSTVGSSVAVLNWAVSDVSASRRRMHAALRLLDVHDPSAVEAYRARLRDAMLAHPADPYLPLLGGALAWRAGDHSPMPWIQRSLERELANGRAHLLLAEVLAARGAKSQALLSVRWAVESDNELVANAARIASATVENESDLESATPDGPSGAGFLEELATALSNRKLESLANSADEMALERNQNLSEVRLRIIERRLVSLDDSSRCPDRQHCRSAIVSHAERLAALDPSSSLGAQVEARLLVLEGDSAAAVRLLEQACDQPKARIDCLRLHAATLAESDPGSPKLRDVLQQFQRESCSGTDRCAGSYRWIGNLRAKHQQWVLAANAYEEAAQLVPSIDNLTRLADAAEKAGQFRRSVGALERQQAIKFSQARQKRISDLKAKAAQQLTEIQSP